MSDITNLFKATVKTVKTQQKVQGVDTGVDKTILKIFPKPGPFIAKAKDVVGNITELKVFLVDHRKQYINTASQSGRDATGMTDADRDQIDADAEIYMKLCSESIKSLQSLECTDRHQIQKKGHEIAVVKLIQSYLKVVCSIYSEQRAVRVKRVVDKKRLSRLAPEKSLNKESFQSRLSRTEGRNKEGPSEGTKVTETGLLKPAYRPHLIVGEEDKDELSPEEIQMFERENQQLYQDMNNMVDEVKQIEGKVVEISQLQEIFADKVLEQEKDIDRIADTVVGTTENIKEANDDIREAMKNNAGLRIWILFFLIVLSLTLLFLDWYNP